jgi:hypothetical protein
MNTMNCLNFCFEFQLINIFVRRQVYCLQVISSNELVMIKLFEQMCCCSGRKICMFENISCFRNII